MRVRERRRRRGRDVAIGLGCAMLLAAASPAVRAQTAEELQQQIEALQRQLQKVQKELDEIRRQQQARKAPPPSAGIVHSGNSKVQLELSGQVNRAVLYTHDGERSDIFFVDNDNSSTRVRFVGKARLTDELVAGTKFEVEFQSNPSNVVNQNNERGVGGSGFNERHLDLYFQHARYGKLSLGQGDTASNSASEVDLSGTAVVGYSSLQDFAGGILFVDDDTGRTGISIGSAFPNLDGLSRDDRIRYDTPSLQGFIASASAIADERWDVALRYRRQFGDTKLAAALAYSDAPDAQKRVNGSGSVRFGNGVNLTFAAGRDDPDQKGRDNPRFLYGKIGYILEMFELGKTAVAADLYYGKDTGADSDRALAVGAFVVQNIDDLATQLYLGYRHYDLDRDGFDLEPVNAVMSGARVKF